jgi:RHS repeat-associated protein
VSAASAQAPDVAVEYYHVDAVGSVRAVTDQSGNVVRRHDYFPFGDGPVEVTAGAEPLRFTGKERDAETGLDYFGARYYAQHSGRLTTVDPVLNTEAALIDPQRWNRYSYALNNPTAYVDQDGRDPQRARAALLAVDSAAAYFGPVAWATAGALTAGYLVYENREAIAETITGAGQALGDAVIWAKDAVVGKEANEGGRFIVEPNGTVADTQSTPAGRYVQPNAGGNTDIFKQGRPRCRS